MKRRFVLPAAIALTAHAVFFLGSGRPPVICPTEPAPAEKPETPAEPPLAIQVVALSGNEDDGGGCGADFENRPVSPDRPGRPPVDTGHVQPLQPVEIDRGDGPAIGPYRPGPKTGRPGFDPGLLTGDQLDLPPRTRSRVAPEYPRSLKALDVTGEVLVEFTVDESGYVHNPRVLRSSREEFEAPTLKAVSLWRFVPGRHGGVPVRFKMSVPIIFKIEA